jgi:hypothetical protein
MKQLAIACFVLVALVLLATGYHAEAGPNCARSNAPSCRTPLPPTPNASPTPSPTSTPTITPTATPRPPSDCLGAPAYPEIRTTNIPYNQTAGQPVPSSMYQEWNAGFNAYKDQVNGQGCLGTTEQILEWAEIKWGFRDQASVLGGPALHYPDIIKAVAVQESDWREWISGDVGSGHCDWTGGPDCPYPDNVPQTFSLLGLKRTSWPGSYPLSHESTAFAADYYGALLRHHLDGASWLSACTTGNLREALGAHYSGECGWGDSWYVNEVLGHWEAKEWQQQWFDDLWP